MCECRAGCNHKDVLPEDEYQAQPVVHPFSDPIVVGRSHSEMAYRIGTLEAQVRRLENKLKPPTYGVEVYIDSWDGGCRATVSVDGIRSKSFSPDFLPATPKRCRRMAERYIKKHKKVRARNPW